MLRPAPPLPAGLTIVAQARPARAPLGRENRDVGRPPQDASKAKARTGDPDPPLILSGTPKNWNSPASRS